MAHSLVRTFVQGVRHVAPPVRPPLPPWDLNLVLLVLQEAPFEDIPLVDSVSEGGFYIDQTGV